MRRRHTLIGAMLMYKNEADGMLCGTFGTHALHLQYIDQVIGRRPGAKHYAAMNAVILPARTVFICDTYVTCDPDAEHIAEMTLLAAEEIRRFGLQRQGGAAVGVELRLDRHAFLGQDAPRARADHASARRSSRSRARCTATRRSPRRSASRCFPNSKLRGEANLLVMPTLDAANISFNLLKTAAGGGVTIGPILLGAARPVHILTPSATVRRIVNMTALAVADANAPRGQEQSLF